MKTPLPDFKLRLSPDLRAQIDDAAKRNSRSVNGEIVARLKWSFAAETDFAKHQEQENVRSELAAQRILQANLTSRPDPIEERFRELEARIAKLESGGIDLSKYSSA